MPGRGQQHRLHRGHDSHFIVGVHQPVGALPDGHRPLGAGPQGQTGHAEHGGLLLHPARIGDHQARLGSEGEEVQIPQRLDEHQPALTANGADAGTSPVAAPIVVSGDARGTPPLDLPDNRKRLLQVRPGPRVDGKHHRQPVGDPGDHPSKTRKILGVVDV